MNMFGLAILQALFVMQASPSVRLADYRVTIAGMTPGAYNRTFVVSPSGSYMPSLYGPGVDFIKVELRRGQSLPGTAIVEVTLGINMVDVWVPAAPRTNPPQSVGIADFHILAVDQIHTWVGVVPFSLLDSSDPYSTFFVNQMLPYGSWSSKVNRVDGTGSACAVTTDFVPYP